MRESDCVCVVYLCKIISRLVCNFVCLYVSVWSLYCKQMAFHVFVYHFYRFFIIIFISQSEQMFAV